jgi:hypothetical protein
LVDTRDTLTDGEKYIWQKLINQKVKIEGAYFTVKGVSLGVQGSNLIVTDPSFFDRKFPLAFKTL